MNYSEDNYNEVRSRKSLSTEKHIFQAGDFEIEEEKQKYKSQTVSPYVAILFLISLLGLFGVVLFFEKQLPTPMKLSDEVLNPDRFIAERAQQHNKYLTSLGPRVVGSYENEVLTVEFLKKEIIEIIHEADKSQEIELDVQVVSGSYYLNTQPVTRINIYANVQNIVVKLHGTNSTNSLLLNAHFDSVPTSPGGSDDGINCAAMLEILRKYSKRKSRLLHNVIFLFNGAEETSLQASHGFITKHKWAKECKVVINLEAAGAGGRIMMFQTGPNRPWLNDDYGKVPHPYGESISEELFQANLIPSDTDFRIFRDYGHIVGIDMAYTRDGYRYHTKYDGFENIPLGSYQHVGDNVMSLVQNMGNNPELGNKNPKTGNLVFFDFFCGIFISYNTTTSLIINVIICGLSLATFFLSLKSFNLGISFQSIPYFGEIIGMILFGWTLAFLSVILMGFLVDMLGYSMSWYRNPWIIIGLFVVPAIITSTAPLLLIKPTLISRNANSFIQAQMFRLIWTSVMMGTAVIGVRSVYPFLILVLFDTLAYILILVFRLEHTVWTWKIIYLIISIVPAAFNMRMMYDFLGFFIPITGRIGSGKVPDVIIGFSSVGIAILILTPYYFLVSLINKPEKFYKILTAVFIIFFGIIFTPLGFPYSGDPDSPAPQRHWILHSQRVFHGEDGGVIKKDSGYFFLNMDRNSPQIVSKYVDEVNRATNLEEDCNNFLLCGLPVAHPKMSQIIKFSTWVPASAPVLTDPVDVKVHSKVPLSPTLIRYNISIVAPDHSMFYLSPKKNFKISNTDVVDQLGNYNLWNDRPYYFFIYICGKELVPLNFTFDVEVTPNYTGPTVDLAVAGNYVHPKRFRMTPDFKKFLSKFPDWADLTTWVANYQSWVF